MIEAIFEIKRFIGDMLYYRRIKKCSWQMAYKLAKTWR
jgi:hypothetical protein